MRVELPSRRVDAEPGQPFVMIVDVTNTSEVIDGFAVGIIGLDPGWVQAESPLISLFPGDRGSKALVITLPSDFPAGERRLGVRVASTVRLGESQVEEFDVVVEPRFEASIRIDPPVATVGKRASLSIVLTNTGNTDTSLFLAGEDPERALRFRFSSLNLSALPGQTASTTVRVSGKRPIFGSPVARVVTIKADDRQHDLIANSTIIQRPAVPRVALVLGVLLVALAAFAFLLTAGINKVVKQSDTASLRAAKAVVDAATAANGGGSGGVTGQVTIGGSSVGLAGTAVAAYASSDPSKSLASTTSDKAGVFQLDGLKVGNYRLRFSAPGFQEVWYPSAPSFDQAAIVPLVPGNAANLSVTLAGLPGSITGTVAGAPNPGGLVVVLIPASPQPTPATAGGGDGATPGSATPGSATPGDGATPGDATPGATTSGATAAPAAFRFDTTPATTPPAITPPAITPPAIITVPGNGPSFGSTPIPAGAKVTTTDAAGVFRFPNVPSPAAYLIEVSASGFSAQTVGVTLAAAEAKVAPQVTLSPHLGAIAGIVTASPLGTPLDGVNVSISVNGATLTAITLSAPISGFYSVSGIPVPGQYEVTYSKAGYQTVIQLADLQPGGSPFGSGIQLQPSSGTLAGIVSGVGGQALSGALIKATSADGKTVLTTTSAVQPAGAFALGNMLAGSYTVTFANPGYAVNAVGVTIVAGQPLLKNVTLAGDGSVGGIISTCNGQPAPGAAVSVLLNGVRVAQGQATSTGAFLISGLVTPNIYQLSFPGNPEPPGFVVVVLGAGQSRTDIAWPTSTACPPPTTTTTSTTTTTRPATTTTSSTTSTTKP